MGPHAHTVMLLGNGCGRLVSALLLLLLFVVVVVVVGCVIFAFAFGCGTAQHIPAVLQCLYLQVHGTLLSQICCR
jgi:uncharacterized integral membrane protein